MKLKLNHETQIKGGPNLSSLKPTPQARGVLSAEFWRQQDWPAWSIKAELLNEQHQKARQKQPQGIMITRGQ